MYTWICFLKFYLSFIFLSFFFFLYSGKIYLYIHLLCPPLAPTSPPHDTSPSCFWRSVVDRNGGWLAFLDPFFANGWMGWLEQRGRRENSIYSDGEGWKSGAEKNCLEQLLVSEVPWNGMKMKKIKVLQPIHSGSDTHGFRASSSGIYSNKIKGDKGLKGQGLFSDISKKIYYEHKPQYRQLTEPFQP